MPPTKRTTTRRDNGAKPSRWHILLPALVIIAGVAAYLNSYSGAFVYDDRVHLAADQRIQHLWPTRELLSRRRPVADFSLAVNYALEPPSPVVEKAPPGFHIFNLAIHLLAGITLYGVVRRTLLREGLRARHGRAAPWLAAAAAMVWVVHPLQTQSVTYIIQRSESLMALFYLLTLYCVIRGADGRRSLPWYVAAVVCCVLGLGSKAVMVTAPVAVFLYDRIFLCSSVREMVRRRWGLYLGLAATWSTLLMFGVLQGVLDPTPRLHASVGFAYKGITPLEYALTQPGVILYYLRLSLWPYPLCLDYGWPVARTAAAIAVPAVIIVGLFAETVWALIRRPRIGFLGAWFFLILLPTSSVIPIKDPLAEHRMYLPLASVVLLIVLSGYAILGSLFGRDAWERWTPRIIATVLVLGVVTGLGYVTRRRNEDYRSSVTMWRDVVAKRPNNPRAHLNYAAHVGDIREATSALREAIRLKPDYADAHYNLGKALHAVGRTEEAIEAYREAVRHDPRHARAYYNLGNTFAREGAIDASIEAYRNAINADPRHFRARFNLAQTLNEKGELDEAAGHYRAVLRLQPHFVKARVNLGKVLAAQGKLDEAVAEFRSVLTSAGAKGQSQVAVLACYNLADVLGRQGKFDEAGEAFRTVLRIKPRDAHAHFGLGSALARQGKIDEAIVEFREALELDPAHPNAGRALEAALARKAQLSEE